MLRTLTADYKEEFQKDFEKLCRKAVKLGLPEPSYSIVRDTYYVKDEGYYKPCIDIELNDVNIILEDWKVVAFIDATTTPVFYTLLEKEIPKECFAKSPYICEHCNTKRVRNQTLIVRNIKTNEYKQVGTTCVEDFTRVKNAEQIVNYYNNIKELWKRPEYERRSKSFFFNVKECLPAFIWQYQTYGWQPSTSTKPSSHIMADILNGFLTPEITDYHKDMASDVIKFAKDNLESAPEGSFKRNCLNALISEMLDFRNKSVPAYIIFGIKMYLESVTNYENEFVGNIGDKIALEGVIDNIFVKDGLYGEAFIVTVNYKNRRVRFFSSVSTKISEKISQMRGGDKIKISGTVKSHNEYNNQKFTLLNRVSIL